MASDVLFANAQIIMHGDTYLLTRKRIRDMVTANDRDTLLRVLAECNYATNFTDDTALLHAERVKTLNTFLELCADPALAQCVTLWDQMTEDNLMANFTQIADLVPKIKSASIREYFINLADLTNVRTFYKGGKTMVPGGVLTTAELKIYPHLNQEQIQTAIDQRLDELGAVNKDDIFQINPLFWWYLQKQKELNVVKTILLCKRFNYDTAVIRASLKGVYEQFQ